MGKRGLVTIDADALIERRKAHGWTQVELAVKGGCSFALVGMIEAGQRQPSLDTLAGLARALECNPTDIATIAEQVA